MIEIEIEKYLNELPVISLAKGELLLEQGDATDRIYFLEKGAVKVSKDGYDVAVVSDKGAVFGEMSVMLNNEHSASVECMEDSSFYVIEDPSQHIEEHPQVILHMAKILSLRLFNLNQYLVDVKRQYEGHDHLQMVDEVLDTLLNQQKTNVVHRQDSQRETPDY